MVERQSNLANILIRAPNWVGDLVMATSSFHDVRRAFPDAHITVLLKPGRDRVISGSPDHDEVLIDSPTPGATFDVLGQAGASGVRPVLASGTTSGGEQTVALQGAGGDEVVLWFTGLTEDDSGRFWAGVGQVELRGTSNSTE